MLPEEQEGLSRVNIFLQQSHTVCSLSVNRPEMKKKLTIYLLFYTRFQNMCGKALPGLTDASLQPLWGSTHPTSSRLLSPSFLKALSLFRARGRCSTASVLAGSENAEAPPQPVVANQHFKLSVMWDLSRQIKEGTII